MAKRASGDLPNASFCCPRRNFKRPRKFKALEGIRKYGCEANKVMGAGCCSHLCGTYWGQRGVPVQGCVTRNLEELSSRQQKRQVKLLSTKKHFWRLDMVLRPAGSSCSVGKPRKPQGK